MSAPPETTVIVIGAGPSGLATAACLTKHSIPYTLLEREHCVASLWQDSTYDRLHLHVSKPFCELPHLPISKNYPKYMSKDNYVEYLTTYASHFNISPRFHRLVTLARYDEGSRKWQIKARIINTVDQKKEEEHEEEYIGKFLVVSTGEMTDPYVPEVAGSNEFQGECIHSINYKSGKLYNGKNVLVIGYGNSGLEIALDSTNNGANTSIVIRGKALVHVLTRGMVDLGLKLWKYLPESVVDLMLMNLSKMVYGDLTKYGFLKPEEGPLAMMTKYGKYPLYDVGTIDKIRSGEIKVLPEIESIKAKEITFVNGESYPFDAIIFATGFKRSTNTWLQGYDHYILKDGMPKESYPNNWKGKNGFYCAGFSRRGLVGHGMDALHIADDINSLISLAKQRGSHKSPTID